MRAAQRTEPVSAIPRPGVEWRWALPAGRVLTLVVLVTATVLAAAPEHRLAALAALAVSLAGSGYGLRFGPDRWGRRLVGLAGLAAGGVALVAIDASAPGWLASGVAITASLVRLPQRPALWFAAAVSVCLVCAPLIRDDSEQALAMAVICGGCAVLGLVLGGIRSRAETAERLLVVEQEARRSAAEAERYAERQRLAREIHDILAHTLSAQTVQLEGARLLLERSGSGQAAPAGVEAALVRIRAAQRLARDGLEETRRAVLSLRGEPRPLAETLRSLADTGGATFRQEGATRPVRAEAALAIERVVQEGLTNARKHAPGARVSVVLRFRDDRDEVEVVDTGPAAVDGGSGVAGAGEPGRGGGYGLVGMRERAALIGAALVTGEHPTGPGERGFRVCLTVPRSEPSGS